MGMGTFELGLELCMGVPSLEVGLGLWTTQIQLLI